MSRSRTSNIRVMHVIDSSRGGEAETSIVETIPTLESRGIETFIVTLFDDGALGGLPAKLDVNRIRRLAMDCGSHLASKDQRALHGGGTYARQSPVVEDLASARAPLAGLC
jgi:hypothetical protein